MKIKSSLIAGKIEVENAEGVVDAVWPYRIQVNDMAKSFPKLMEKYRADPDNPKDVLIEMLTAVFGSELEKEMEEYYRGDFTALVTDLLPFLQDVVFPAIASRNAKVLNVAKKSKW